MSNIIIKQLDIVIGDIAKEAKKLEGKTVLISGGSGFLGTYLNTVFYLLNKKILKVPCKVISVDNYITGHRKNFLINFEKN